MVAIDRLDWLTGIAVRAAYGRAGVVGVTIARQAGQLGWLQTAEIWRDGPNGQMDRGAVLQDDPAHSPLRCSTVSFRPCLRTVLL